MYKSMEIFPIPEAVFEPNRFFVIVSVIVFFSAVMLWPLGWFFRRPAMNTEGTKPPEYRLFFTISRYFATGLVYLSLLSYFYLRHHPEWMDVSDFTTQLGDAGWPDRLFLSLPSILGVLVPVQLLVLIPVWVHRHGTKIFRIHYSLVVAALVIFLLFLMSWQVVAPAQYMKMLL